MASKNGIREKSGTTRDSTNVQVITRAASILWTLRDNPEGLSLSQLAKKLGLARSTVHRIVSSLENERFVAWERTNGKVRLGLGLASLGGAVSTDLRRTLRPYIEGLSIELDETVDLAVLDKDHALFLDQVTALQRLQAVSAIGLSFPLHCTANGKAMLALLPLDNVKALLPDRLEAFTSHTITSRKQLFDELEIIRNSGIAFDREEQTIGICAVGTAFRDPSGMIGAISIPAPSIRFYGNEKKSVLALTRTGDVIRNYFNTF